MSVDLGKARTGIAVCDKTMLLASPVCVLEVYDREKLAQRVAQEADKLKAELIVLGLPKNMDGSEGDSAKGARYFAQLLAQFTEVPVKLWDERCTTMIAHRYLNDVNVRGKKRKQTVDAAAAAIILQSYIDSIKTQ